LFDLGKDVSPKSFVDEAERIGADVIALSALLTVTRPFQADVISLLKERGIREKFKVVVGGGPTSSEWATSIGADDWAEDASGAVKIIKRMFPN
jgi:methanogenic corrinoid protein MtbC1